MTEFINSNHLIDKLQMLNDLALAFVIMMGSNTDNAKENIILAIDELQKIGQVQLLNSHTSADHTGKSQNMYANTAIILALTKKTKAILIYHTLKELEKLCGRNHQSCIVALDLDIMAVYIDKWYIIKERLPFKEHEKICMGISN